MKLSHASLIIFLVLLLDQVSKIYIKTHFMIDQSIHVFDWFHIRFIENPGAAWGVKIPGMYGKLILTIFRIIAIMGIGYWLWDSVKRKAPKILIISIALIFAGALGNIIDSILYGVIFDSSVNNVATFMSNHPYGTLFHGKVVDMLYFPLIDTTLPEWVPYYGGSRFTFFDPVFNIADASISIAVGLLIIFNKKAFKK
ncbi:MULTISPECIES: lipoprotein signal peptidase [unclassified Capnocytophaga]|uniref:lipoprotein signal peptidase n=1 Tax=unclassified Capnocytophaga TaxID=2640652 RepID=UPI000202F4C1|nr:MULTISPECIES: lipoprotein signal peptidase [unclassified Capnocytophaga]EGD34291.1 signal peptidase II [Capnocytophaga sp. oral taxon 338 str. F0234]MEB3004726.1 lipoprotein signal peptidase [Capnocytophaga sp. G2]